MLLQYHCSCFSSSEHDILLVATWSVVADVSLRTAREQAFCSNECSTLSSSIREMHCFRLPYSQLRQWPRCSLCGRLLERARCLAGRLISEPRYSTAVSRFHRLHILSPKTSQDNTDSPVGNTSLSSNFPQTSFTSFAPSSFHRNLHLRHLQIIPRETPLQRTVSRVGKTDLLLISFKLPSYPTFPCRVHVISIRKTVLTCTTSSNPTVHHQARTAPKAHLPARPDDPNLLQRHILHLRRRPLHLGLGFPPIPHLPRLHRALSSILHLVQNPHLPLPPRTRVLSPRSAALTRSLLARRNRHHSLRFRHDRHLRVHRAHRHGVEIRGAGL